MTEQGEQRPLSEEEETLREEMLGMIFGGSKPQSENTLSLPDDEAYERLKVHVRALLSPLTKRQREVLELRFGLFDGRVYTLEEVGDELGISKQRVHQIESIALKKLPGPRWDTESIPPEVSS